MISMTPLIIMSLSIGIAAWLIFMWAVKSGQFDDIEGPKHRMLEDDEVNDKGGNKAGKPEGGAGEEDGKDS